MWVFMQIFEIDSVLYVFTIVFIFGFEFGPGPIVWLYLSEICNDKATSVNTVVNWAWVLVMSLITPVMFDHIHGWTFFIFGCTCLIGFFYIVFKMKETKG